MTDFKIDKFAMPKEHTDPDGVCFVCKKKGLVWFNTDWGQENYCPPCYRKTANRFLKTWQDLGKLRQKNPRFAEAERQMLDDD